MVKCYAMTLFSVGHRAWHKSESSFSQPTYTYLLERQISKIWAKSEFFGQRQENIWAKSGILGQIKV